MPEKALVRKDLLFLERTLSKRRKPPNCRKDSCHSTMNLKIFSFALTIICQKNGSWGWIFPPKHTTAKSCLDYLKRGVTTNGYYHINNDGTNGLFHTAYCDFKSEPGMAWTLVESFAFKNVLLPPFRVHPLKTNSPVNSKSPNWQLYRMSYQQMDHLKSQSTHWRVTCSFPENHSDVYRDYARTTFKRFDVLNFLSTKQCKKMEYINIRGQQCAECTAAWFALKNQWALHVNAPSTGCEFNAGKDAVVTEDSFGYYGASNKKFRCTSEPQATTNYWFGGYT